MEIVVECQNKLVESQNKTIDDLTEQIKDLKKEILRLKVEKEKDREELDRLKSVADRVGKLENIIRENKIKINSETGTRNHYRACYECGLLHDERFISLIKCELCNRRVCNNKDTCAKEWNTKKSEGGWYNLPYCHNH